MYGLKNLKIGELKARIPVIQGGMGVGISLSGLPSAAADLGGLPVIATARLGMFEPDAITNYLEANTRVFEKQDTKGQRKDKGDPGGRYHGGPVQLRRHGPHRPGGKD